MKTTIKLVILSLFLVSTSGYAQNNTWSNTMSKDFKGPDGYLSSISAGPKGVFVGGGFSSCGGNFIQEIVANNITQWKDTAWNSVGIGSENGVNGYIESMCTSSQGIYVCGTFKSAGTIGANKIALWNGAAWSSLESALPEYRSISAISASGNYVYAGGIFDSIGGNAIISIAKYNGTSWSGLGAGLRKISTERSFSPYGQVNVIASKDSNVYVGGIFDTAGSVPVKNIAHWNGSTWQAMGAGIRFDNIGSINAIIEMPNGDVYVGGSFDTAGTVPAKNIARWNGTEWSAVGSLDFTGGGRVEAFAMDSNRLYVGGAFGNYSDSMRSLAMWDGSAWHSVGGGVMGDVRDISFYDGSLYVMGRFSEVGYEALETWNIAKWQVREPDTTGKGASQPPSSDLITTRSFPNPTGNDEITIEFTLKNSGNTTIQMVTTEGQVLEQLASHHYEAGTYTVVWKISKGAPSQVYYCQISQNGDIKAHKIIRQH